MKEDIFNLYLITEGNFITKLGAKIYTIDGTDDDKTQFLKDKAEKDIRDIDIFNVPANYQVILNGENVEGRIRPVKYAQLAMIGKGLDIFFEVFEHYKAPERPLCCISHIVDGIFKKDGESESELKSNSEEFSLIEFSETDDFLEKYTRNGQFHVLNLIEDDFFAPIDLLSENGYLIPATKLLFSSIDSFAFLSFGDNTSYEFRSEYLVYPPPPLSKYGYFLTWRSVITVVIFFK